jgi:hypothetical protein
MVLFSFVTPKVVELMDYGCHFALEFHHVNACTLHGRQLKASVGNSIAMTTRTVQF